MAESVLNQINRQCRNAMLGGVPIIYVKTASKILIRSLAEDESNPLVVLLSRSLEFENRPVSEKRLAGKLVSVGDIKNYKPDRLPDTYSGIDYPHIWTYRMPDEGDRSGIYAKLEAYVMDHEDADCGVYNILQSSVVILYSEEVHLSPMLRTYTQIIEVPYPDEEEIRGILLSESGGDRSLTENEAYLSALCTAFLGFTEEEIVMTMQKIMASDSLAHSMEAEAMISAQKRQKMQGGILEQCAAGGNIGGMQKFQEWLNAQIEPLKNANLYMRKTGTPPPKGVLLCGIPGCGKSEAAKFTADTLKLPLLKMDIGSMMDKYQGVSEQRMREALKMAEAMSPCVLWIDELEKGFSGAGSDNDSSSFKRMFGYMLGWMQENQKPCFIFATANDIGGLPKEFFRSGRFDALYAVYLPTAAECASIFLACMKKAERNIAAVRHIPAEDVTLFGKDCYTARIYRRLVNDMLVRRNTDGVLRPRIIVGADIQKIINIALRSLLERPDDRNGLSFPARTASEAESETGIPALLWEQTLRKVIQMPTCSVYGDGDENIDSIAVSYCRMLKKGFIPTTDEVLFRTEDYHPENLEQYERLKRLPAAQSGEEREAHIRALRAAEIMQERGGHFSDGYDEALYTYLRKRINEVAPSVEKREREQMIRR